MDALPSLISTLFMDLRFKELLAIYIVIQLSESECSNKVSKYHGNIQGINGIL
jgi:hypothetical protein